MKVTGEVGRRRTQSLGRNSDPTISLAKMTGNDGGLDVWTSYSHWLISVASD